MTLLKKEFWFRKMMVDTNLHTLQVVMTQRQLILMNIM